MDARVDQAAAAVVRAQAAGGAGARAECATAAALLRDSQRELRGLELQRRSPVHAALARSLFAAGDFAGARVYAQEQLRAGDLLPADRALLRALLPECNAAL